jgi:hypothetical protein
VAENDVLMRQLLRRDAVCPTSLEELFAMFDHYCNPLTPMPSFQESQLITGLEFPADLIARGGEIPIELSKPTFSIIRKVQSREGRAADSVGQTPNF